MFLLLLPLLLISAIPAASSFDIAKVVASASAVPTAKSPCPSSQLLRYFVHVGGNGDAEAAVCARCASSSSSSPREWHEVGRVAACTDVEDNDDPFSFGLESAVARAGVAAHALAQATMLQRRLISEHAYRLHPQLCEMKRESGLELGLQMLPDLVAPVPPSAAGDVDTSLDMRGVGFVGSVPSPSPTHEERRSISGLYEDFWTQGGATEYDGESMRLNIENLLASSRDGATAPFLVCSQPKCNIAAEVRTTLDERSILYSDMSMQSLSPMHAEMAFLTGKASMPYIFVNGEPLEDGAIRDGSIDITGVLELMDARE